MSRLKIQRNKVQKAVFFLKQTFLLTFLDPHLLKTHLETKTNSSKNDDERITMCIFHGFL